jgi:hypothetical protein
MGTGGARPPRALRIHSSTVALRKLSSAATIRQDRSGRYGSALSGGNVRGDGAHHVDSCPLLAQARRLLQAGEPVERGAEGLPIGKAYLKASRMIAHVDWT